MPDPLLTDLKARLTAGGITTPIHLSGLQATPDAAIALTDYSAGPPRDVAATGLPVLEALAVQVLTRGSREAGTSGAMTTAVAAMRALVGRHLRLPPTGPDAGARVYDWIAAAQHPYHLGFDQQDRPLIVFNVLIQRHGNPARP